MPHWDHTGTTTGSITGLYWVHYGSILGPLLDLSGTNTGFIRDQYWIYPGPVLTTAGTSLDYCRDKSWLFWEILRKYWNSWLFWEFLRKYWNSWLFWEFLTFSEKSWFFGFPFVFPNFAMWTRSEEGPDPYHGGVPRNAPSRYTNTPGTPPHRATGPHCCTGPAQRVSEGKLRFTRLLSLEPIP